MRKGIPIAAGILVIALSFCERENMPGHNETEDMTFTIGTICGWCAGVDSLVICLDSSHYESSSPFYDRGYKVNAATDPAAWEELTKLFDPMEFQKIALNTCYVCADGCDTWISVEGGSVRHRIRFGYQDSLALQSIRPFITRLEALISGFRADKGN